MEEAFPKIDFPWLLKLQLDISGVVSKEVNRW